MAHFTHTFAHKLEETRWGTAVYAALVAGVSFLVLQVLITALIQGYSPWLPLQLMASIVLGTEALGTVGFSLEVLLTAFLVHFVLSIMTAWILAPIIEEMPLYPALMIGAAMGLLIYVVNFYLLTEAYSWFAGIRGWATLANHLVFGMVLAWVYARRRLTEH